MGSGSKAVGSQLSCVVAADDPIFYNPAHGLYGITADLSSVSEVQGCILGGGLEMEKISGCVSDTSPDMSVEEFEKIFLGFVEHNGWSFEGTLALTSDGFLSISIVQKESTF